VKSLLEINSIEQLLELDFSEKAEMSYRYVRLLGEWYHCDVDRWREVFLKLCFLCENTLIIDIRVDSSPAWRIRMEGSEAVLGPYAANYRFTHQGFSVTEKQKINERVTRFTATRMPSLTWDGKTPLNDYEDSVVVTLPLAHPQFDSYRKDVRTEQRQKDEKKLLREFVCWQFAPLLYCQTCRRVHDGGHRWQVVRTLGWKEVAVRIARYGRDDERQYCRNVERRRKEQVNG